MRLTGSHSVSSTRGTLLQRPFQVFAIAAEFLLILLCYAAASASYNAAWASGGDGTSIGAGLVVALVFIAIAYFQAPHRLLSLVWQLRKALVIWLVSLTILAVAAFLLKSTNNLSRGTVIIFTAIGGVALISLRFAWRFPSARALRRDVWSIARSAPSGE